MTDTRCNWCETVHDPHHICDAAKEVLDKLWEKSQSAAAAYDLPTMEFVDEIGANVEGSLCKAIAVNAFHTLTLGIYRPGIIIQPILLDDSRLKPLVLVDDDVHMRRVGRLFDDMTSLAVRRAKKARDEAFKNRSV